MRLASRALHVVALPSYLSRWPTPFSLALSLGFGLEKTHYSFSPPFSRPFFLPDPFPPITRPIETWNNDPTFSLNSAAMSVKKSHPPLAPLNNALPFLRPFYPLPFFLLNYTAFLASPTFTAISKTLFNHVCLLTRIPFRLRYLFSSLLTNPRSGPLGLHIPFFFFGQTHNGGLTLSLRTGPIGKLLTRGVGWDKTFETCLDLLFYGQNYTLCLSPILLDRGPLPACPGGMPTCNGDTRNYPVFPTKLYGFSFSFFVPPDPFFSPANGHELPICQTIYRGWWVSSCFSLPLGEDSIFPVSLLSTLFPFCLSLIRILSKIRQPSSAPPQLPL